MARHLRHPSHAVLFNFRGGAGVAGTARWGVNVSGRLSTDSAIDGVDYLATILEDAKNYEVEEILIPKKVVMVGLLHEDLSAFTRPNTVDRSGRQRFKVSERDGFWIVSNMIETQKRARLYSVEQETVIILRLAQDQNDGQCSSGGRGGGDGGGGDDGGGDGGGGDGGDGGGGGGRGGGGGGGGPGGGGGGGPGGGGGGAPGGGPGGGGGGGGVPWVVPAPQAGPFPDVYTDNDRQQHQVTLIQAVKGGQMLTYRESRRCRDPNLGTVPYPVANQGLPPFPQNHHDRVYDNRLLIPSLLAPEDFKTLFGFSSDEFYQIR